MGSYITVGEYLRHLYEKDKLMDVAVHVKDKTFSAHRVALSCYSEYFAELFSRNKGRKIPFEMRLRGITPEAFAIFLEFVYTGRLKFVYTNQNQLRHTSVCIDIMLISQSSVVYFKNRKQLENSYCSKLDKNILCVITQTFN